MSNKSTEKKSIEIIIRAFNEEDWLISCLQSISEQKILPSKIQIIDNNSSDSTAARAKYLIDKSPLNIEYSLYLNSSEGYRPGKCLNQFALRSSCKYIVFLSAHCIPVDANWLKNLYDAIREDDDVAGVYGRQLPTNKSDSRDARDLIWTFGHDERIHKKDPFFHNANSIVRKSALELIPFREDLTNIEDRVWASDILNTTKYKIKYSPKSVVFHEHGIHQAGKIKRANQIVDIAKQYTDLFSRKAKNKILGCIIPFKPTSDSIDIEALDSAISVASSLLPDIKTIVCSIDTSSKTDFKYFSDKAIVQYRQSKLNNGDPDLRDILLDIIDQCENSDIYFEDILVLEPYYLRRTAESIKRLINSYQSSSAPVALFKSCLKMHVWHETKNKLIRIDSFELKRDVQEKIIMSPRGLGMITSISNLRSFEWLDNEVEFVEIKDFNEAIPYLP